MKRLYSLIIAVATVFVTYAGESVFTPVDENLYPNNMTMVIRLMDGDAVVDTAEVAAFIGGECRGAVRAASNGLYYLVINGEGVGETITLRTCLDGDIITIDNILQFVSDGNIGTSWDPYVIDLQNRNVVFIKGDANGDGIVNIADIVAIVNDLSGTTQSAIVREAADANSDGVVNAEDIVTIVNNIFLSR